MSIPIRHLPVVQNWDCHECGNCCKEYQVNITEAEKTRIEKQGWQNEPGFQDVRLFLRRGLPWRREWQLNHRADSSCVFLSVAGRCRIHERFGYEAKPLPCRLYPFLLVPANDHWRVGLRYACPSAAANLGRPLAQHGANLKDFAAGLLERGKVSTVGGKFGLGVPQLQTGQHGTWDDVQIFAQALLGMVTDRRDRMERRLRKCLALSVLARQAKYDNITGPRLVEFLDILRGTVEHDVPRNPSELPPPSRVGRVLFRMFLALFTRRDQGPLRGSNSGRRLTLLRAGIAFARGKGTVPRLHAWLPQMTFAEVDAIPTRSDEDTEQILERYFTTKIGSLQFFGALFFAYPLWDGLEALALMFPILHFLMRMLHELPPADALTRALTIADDHFGCNKMLRSLRYRMMYRILASRGEMERLIAWYSR
jgi:lysine-N-methylase